VAFLSDTNVKRVFPSYLTVIDVYIHRVK